MNDTNGQPTTLHGLLRSRVVLVPLFAGGLLTTAQWVTAILLNPPRDHPIILHYNVYFGVDWVGDWYLVFLFPAVTTLVLCVNVIVAYLLRRHMPAMIPVLIWSALLIGLAVSAAGALMLEQNL